MGVPSLFRNIVEYDEKAYYWKDDMVVDNLYFDFNNLIHFCKNRNSKLSEEDLIIDVIKYTTYITTKLIKPKELVYIAFDGPVPYGKIMRQRARRYKKYQDLKYKQKLYKKFGMEYYENFDSNNISPGTSFMSKLSSRIRNFIKLGAFSTHEHNRRFSVILSDSNIEGEGEHKIFKHIKQTNCNIQSNSVIYGMDADLIILSMECYKNNIKLLREYEECAEEFRVLDIDLCRKALLHIHDLHQNKYDERKIIKDFVYFSFFGGNDFVPSFPSLQIRTNGLSYLFSCYKELLDTCSIEHHIRYLIDENNVPNGKILLEFIKILETQEHQRLVKKIKKIKHKSSNCNSLLNLKKTKEEKLEYIVNNYEHSYYYCSTNPFNNYYKDELNKIYYEDENWNVQYNNYFFENVDIDDVCDRYLGILKWTFDYYINNTPPSWYYHYEFRNSPSLKDFLLNGNFEKMTNFKYKQNYILPKGVSEDIPLSPYEQLMIIMPIQNINSILPKPFIPFIKYDDSPLNDMYVKYFNLDVLVGYKNIYSEPILDNITIDFTKLKRVINNVILNDMEWNRNILRTNYYIKTF